jgi:hypothetical protein
MAATILETLDRGANEVRKASYIVSMTEDELEQMRERTAMQTELDALRQRVSELEAALRFYASETSWKGHLEGGYGSDRKQIRHVTPALMDKGEKARQALK